jgi:hypothetical protein
LFMRQLQRMLDATTNQRRKVRRDIEKVCGFMFALSSPAGVELDFFFQSAFDCMSGGPIVLSASSGIRDQLGAAVGLFFFQSNFRNFVVVILSCSTCIQSKVRAPKKVNCGFRTRRKTISPSIARSTWACSLCTRRTR